MTLCGFARTITRPQLCEYVDSLSFSIKWVPLYNTVFCQVPDGTKEVVFVQVAPALPLLLQLLSKQIKVWVLNTEQLSRLVSTDDQQHSEEVGFDFEAWLLCWIRPKQFISIMDYSAANLEIWKRLFPKLECRLVPFLPVLAPLSTVLLSSHNTKPVVFVGDVTSSYRQEILKPLDDVIEIVTNTFGPLRDAKIASSKIVLNIHFGASYTVFEELRCLPCVLQKKVIVSEASQLPKDHPLYKFIIFVPYKRLVACVRSAIRNYDALYQKLYLDNPQHTSLLDDLRLYADTVNSSKTQGNEPSVNV